jgi:dihydrofolate synthase / folylpolyglutamate synthase
MGGRLDSTNIIQPIVSVITNISLDHQQYLGDTLEKIAFEKGGIIKHQTPVVIGEIQSETLEVFTTIAKQKEARIYLDYSKKERFNKCKTNSYQDKNIITCLKTIEVLEEKGFDFDEEILFQSIRNFKSISNLKGRWQVLSSKPKMICDTGHNIAGMREVIKLFEQESFKQLHFVFGMVAEKDVSEVLSILPKNGKYYFCQADNPRAMSAEELSNKASVFSLIGETFNSVEKAIIDAQLNASENDLIFIGGSNFVVAEIPFL